MQKLEEKFGRNKMALTFALPFKNGVAKKAERQAKKIFESWETIALYFDFYRDKTIGKSS